MADVRSMLQSERAARRIAHPYASYTKSGLLTCSLCNIALKSDAKWEAHLHSSTHLEQQKALALDTVSRKRKAGDDDDDDHEPKKSRHVMEDNSTLNSSVGAAAEESHEEPPSKDERVGTGTDASLVKDGQTSTAGAGTPDASNSIDEVEWAAFEKDIRDLEEKEQRDMTNPLTVYAAAASYEAAPMTAVEVESANAQRGQAAAELESEKEDAARQMEEEFGEMEELEERVNKLKERRQALRRESNANEQEEEVNTDQDRPPEQENDESSGEDEDEEEWLWGLRSK